MRPERVNKHLNRRKKIQAILALKRKSFIKISPQKKEGGESNEAGGNTLKCVTSTAFPSAPQEYEEVTWQNDQQEPLDMRVNQPVIIAKNKRPTSGFQQPILSSRGYKNSKVSLIKDRKTSTAFNRFSLQHFSAKKPNRTEREVLRDDQEVNNQKGTEKPIDNNPLMPFTLEEEFKVIEYIVKLEDYFSQRLIFISKNFGCNVCFPYYFPLIMKNSLSKAFHGKLSYNPAIEECLLYFGLNYIQSNVDNFFDDMKFISKAVKFSVLETGFPATQIIFYGLMETNNCPKPLYLGPVKVDTIRMKDMERFSSPWAIDYADEDKFENTVNKVGKALGSDVKLQTLYSMLILITPCRKQV